MAKSTYLYSNFGSDLLWVALGTSAERPMLWVRTSKNGQNKWADFLDYSFFRIARQHGKAAASESAIKAQGAMVKQFGPSPGATEYALGPVPQEKLFAEKNPVKAGERSTLRWPHLNGNWIALDFAALVCPWCLKLEYKADHSCITHAGITRHSSLGWSRMATSAAVDQQRKGQEPIEQAKTYVSKVKELIGQMDSKQTATKKTESKDQKKSPASGAAALLPVPRSKNAAPGSETGQPALKQVKFKGKTLGLGALAGETPASAIKAQSEKKSKEEEALGNKKPQPRKSQVKLSLKQQAWVTEEAVPDARVVRDELDHWKIALDVQDSVAPKNLPKRAKDRSDITEKLRVELSCPSLEGGPTVKVLGWALNKGMTIMIPTGSQINRCLFIILACGVGTSAQALYKEVLRDCVMYLDRVEDLSDEFAARAVSKVVDSTGHKLLTDHVTSLQGAKGAAFNVTVRSQTCDLSFLKVAWPYKSRGNKPFLLTWRQNGRTRFTLYILAVDGLIRSELRSLTTEGLAHKGHVYEQLWDDAAESLDLHDTLTMLTRQNRQADVGVVYCLRMEDTLAGKTPMVPDYMAGHELMNAANEGVHMGATTADNGTASEGPTSRMNLLVSDADSQRTHQSSRPWHKATAIKDINAVITKLATTVPVGLSVVPLASQLNSSFQQHDLHPAVYLSRGKLLDWKLTGAAFSDFMDIQVQEQMEVVEQAYDVLAWQAAMAWRSSQIMSWYARTHKWH